MILTRGFQVMSPWIFFNQHRLGFFRPTSISDAFRPMSASAFFSRGRLGFFGWCWLKISSFYIGRKHLIRVHPKSILDKHWLRKMLIGIDNNIKHFVDFGQKCHRSRYPKKTSLMMTTEKTLVDIDQKIPSIEVGKKIVLKGVNPTNVSQKTS